MRRRCITRRGTTVVEVAIVGPVTFLLLIGLLVGALGVFRYDQVGYLAREASRWASVHGTDFVDGSNQPAATANDIYQQVILPKAVGMDTSRLTYSVSWNASNSPYRTVVVNNNSVKIANTVTVTVSYQWVPTLYFGGVTMSSTSVATMSY